MTSGTGEVVCAPCVFSIGSTPTAPRKLTVRVNDLIMARGGFGTSMAAKKGIGLLDLTNDVDWLSIESRLEYSDAEPGDLYLCPVAPRDVLKDWFVPSQARVFVLPEVRDRSESGSGLPKVIDCYLTAAYVGGLGDVPAGTGATVELYLYDDNGAPMSGSAGPICAPCSYTLGTGLPASASRWLEVDIGNLSPVPATKQGFAVVRVAGADPGAVVLEQFEEAFHASPTARSHSGRLLTALALPTGTLAVDEPDAAGATLMLRSSPNPAAGAMTFDFDLAHRADVDLDVFDAAGRRVATVYSGARPAGRQSLQWNRRDDQGNTMAAGIYYGRLRANDGSRVTRLVFLP